MDRTDWRLSANLTAMAASQCASSYELVLIALTFPLWSFAVLYAILMIIHYLRAKQYHYVYDKCSWRNAHFRYDFHMVIGKHSGNYSQYDSYAILDLLDNQLISNLTIQIPGATMFNDHQMFVYRHSRDNLRCINFTIYRRHPIKDIKCIRIAHTCSNPDSRLYIYGLQIHDHTNSENRFFPIQSVVKYRGTQWALVTTFEPKPELNFKKLGVDCYDPLGFAFWPTYLEVLTILLYIWCAAYCFGHLMSVKEMFGNVPLHALTILFITATSAAVLCLVYLRFIKIHIVDNCHDSYWWLAGQVAFVLLVVFVSLGFWTLAVGESKRCLNESIDWLISTGSCSAALTLLIIIVWYIADWRRKSADRRVQTDTDAQLAKTNSRENLQFVNDPSPGFCVSLFTRQRAAAASAHSSGREGPPKNWNALGPQSESQKAKGNAANRKGRLQDKTGQPKQQDAHPPATPAKEGDDTLDTAFGVGSKYIKARNRNSISQYV